MDRIALDIVYHLAELQYEHNIKSGQRWPVVLYAAKKDILNFRSVCKAFRDASWVPFRNLLAERIFYLDEDDLRLLSDIACHKRLGPLINTLTFGSQVYTSRNLQILERGLETHPIHADENLVASPGWQRSIAARCELCYEGMVQFKQLYEESLGRQETFWSTGGAIAALSDCLYRLPNIRSIRVFARPCHVTFQTRPDKDGNNAFATHGHRINHFVPHGTMNQMRCNGWRNIDRTLVALSKLDASKVNVHELQTSSLNNVRWPIDSTIFFNKSLFKNLRTLKLSIREEIRTLDAVLPDATHPFIQCLTASKHLKSLDLETCGVGSGSDSYTLACLAQQHIPYQLEELVLEYNCQTEQIFTALIRPHVATLRKLTLLNSWITDGKWSSWLRGMKSMGLKLDNLEVWKPCQGKEGHFREQEDWFDLSVISAVARRGKAVPFLPQEKWDNCYPRLNPR